MKKVIAKIAIALFVISIAASCTSPTDAFDEVDAPEMRMEIQDIKNNG